MSGSAEQDVRGAAVPDRPLPIPHAIIDHAMGEDFAAQLHRFACGNTSGFTPAEVTSPQEKRALDPDVRRSLAHWGSLGDLGEAFEAAMRQRGEELFGAVGMQQPDRLWVEYHLAVHRDGDFFHPHVDLFAEAKRRFAKYDRMLTLVYYFGRDPATFDGGELRLLAPFGAGDGIPIAPVRDRLVAFPSFLPHEVCTVSMPDGNFADARFSLNCWIGRPRD